MSMLTIAQSLALNVGMEVPDQVIGSGLREWREAVQFANEAGDELARRVQWGALTRTIDMTAGGALPADFGRMVEGTTATVANQPVRALTQAEWPTIPASTGTPRYFLLSGKQIAFWPDGPATIVYQSSAWCSNGSDEFTADDDTALIDEDLLLKALVVRWRRQKGMPYADEEAEFEAALAAFAQFDDRSRV